jgi:hypothetical protein
LAVCMIQNIYGPSTVVLVVDLIHWSKINHDAVLYCKG